MKQVSTENCWLFAKTIDPQGYGRIKLSQTSSNSAHRILYEIWVGEIPKGYVIDHLCRVRRCINPEHLEAVTISENVKRGAGYFHPGRWLTHCKKGHKFSDDNILIQADGKRKCKKCRRAYDKWYNSTQR